MSMFTKEFVGWHMRDDGEMQWLPDGTLSVKKWIVPKSRFETVIGSLSECSERAAYIKWILKLMEAAKHFGLQNAGLVGEVVNRISRPNSADLLLRLQSIDAIVTSRSQLNRRYDFKNRDDAKAALAATSNFRSMKGAADFLAASELAGAHWGFRLRLTTPAMHEVEKHYGYQMCFRETNGSRRRLTGYGMVDIDIQS